MWEGIEGRINRRRRNRHHHLGLIKGLLKLHLSGLCKGGDLLSYEGLREKHPPLIGMRDRAVLVDQLKRAVVMLSTELFDEPLDGF